MSLTAFPEPKDLQLNFEDMVLDGRPKSFNQYSVENPHPGFGKDPSILNEYGHTAYPKMIYPEGPSGAGVVVNDAAEEARYYKPEASVPASPAPDAPKASW